MVITEHVVPTTGYTQFIQEEPVRVSAWPGDIYYLNEQGRLHREDGPAYIGIYGSEDWYFDGMLHREGGPAKNGSRTSLGEWYQHGKLHRHGGPAKICHPFQDERTEEEWYIDGLRHREDGPAVKSWRYNFFSKTRTHEVFFFEEWWLYGKYVSIQEEIREDWKWLLIKGNLENIKVIKNPSKKLQAYVLNRRPDLASSINNVHSDVKKRFWHELELSEVDL
jgi:hypothetical protein